MCVDYVVFAVGTGSRDFIASQSTRPQFTMKIRDLAMWDRLGYSDLTYNEVMQAESSQVLKEFQQNLGRKRYVSPIPQVRTALPCCRPPNLRCSRRMWHILRPFSPTLR